VHHALSENLWSWINKREEHRQEPTVSEQYDVLLKFFTGHSLKDVSPLWEAFQNLKQARNRFVHEGVARIGNDPVGADRAADLVKFARQIVAQTREWLPDAVQWPTFECRVKVEITSRPFPGVANPDGPPAGAE